MNRTERRRIGKKYRIKSEAIPLVNLGECFYCKQPVYAGEGQSIKYMKEGLKATGDGQTKAWTNETLTPTHKLCRKEA